MATIKVVYGNNVDRNSVLVDSGSTLRETLESVGFDYSRAKLNLDGTSLQAGDLDRTFDHFGITERCFLLNVVKADNAASIDVVGDAIIIKSALSLEDIKMVEKYRPAALTLFGGEDGKEPLFTVGASGSGGCNKYGITFRSESRDDAKLAILTIFSKDMCGDIKSYIADKYGAALLNLNKIETTLPDVLDEIREEHERVVDAINVA